MNTGTPCFSEGGVGVSVGLCLSTVPLYKGYVVLASGDSDIWSERP